MKVTPVRQKSSPETTPQAQGVRPTAPQLILGERQGNQSTPVSPEPEIIDRR
ncbi:hypothetical protein [Levilactobacillus sp. HBUAS70063]|uniref:hypothetical protein n=1 Tax=Levilactobacillus sp. HBUAS70063 TaxID=3109359 RepID=UPI0031332F31